MNSGRQPPESSGAAHHGTGPFSLATATTTCAAVQHQPRAARAFSRQGLQVQPLTAESQLSATDRNRLALRETAATPLYRLQGRM